MRVGAAAMWMILGLLAARPASAQAQTVAQPVAKLRRPVQPRVFHVPTAWLQPHGALFGVAGLSHRVDPFVAVTAGLGGVAEVDVQLTDTSNVAIPTALFKTGVAARRLGRWQPALALAFRKSFTGPAVTLPSGGDPVTVRTAQLSLAASLTAGAVDLHAGIDLWDAAVDVTALHDDAELSARVRPFVGLEWRPRIYPRSTVLADLGWAPRFAAPDDVTLRWVAGAGIRYQALSWGAVDLAVRFREGDKLDDAAVFVRLSAFLID